MGKKAVASGMGEQYLLNFSLLENFLPKIWYKTLDWKFAILGEFRDWIEVLSTHKPLSEISICLLKH